MPKLRYIYREGMESSYTGCFTDSSYFEMLITPSIFELSLKNKKAIGSILLTILWDIDEKSAKLIKKSTR